MLPATITKIQEAFKEIKRMHCDTWEGDYRPAARDALKDILEHRMDNAVDAHLEQKRTQGLPDRRNGSYPRHLLTELGDLGLRIPRTGTFSARVLLKRLARRTFSIERLILLSFLQVKVSLPPSASRTTNAIERRFREIRSRTRPMGTFSDRTSMDRIMFSVFAYENLKEGTGTPFLLLTQNT